MDENNQMNVPPPPEFVQHEVVQPTVEPKIVQTDAGAKDGQNKCPKCGATDISLNVAKGMLRCNFCRHEFEPEKVQGMETDLSKLEGQVIGSGAQDIIADVSEVLTFKCSSCAAEVVIDTASSMQARCHWCRNTLSVNQQIPNGAVPDMVLPFQIKKDVAKAEIEKFVGKRKFFAHPQFTKEFCADNVMGVYLPYMVVDINAHANLAGQGEIETRRYTRGSGKDKETLYDADLYDVKREFDIVVDGLTVESSADKLNTNAKDKTNNIINSIMPFDTENSAKWNANYLKGYTSEKRDTNIDQLKPLVQAQAKDISRHQANDTLKQYDRGVAWAREDLNVKGEQWKAAYLPVWLYSYHQKNKNLLHYVAVNARTKETMGSVPINKGKLFFISFLLEVAGLIFWLASRPLWLWMDENEDLGMVALLLGFIFYGVMYARYRNKGARHSHEKETKATKNNVRVFDNFVESRKGLKNSSMKGANNTSIGGNDLFSKAGSVLNSVIK